MSIYQVTPKELADKMSVTGIEVEGITVPEEGLKKIVVGEVMECVPHPDSDHLSICQVDIGEEELSQIVCGAPNVKRDQSHRCFTKFTDCGKCKNQKRKDAWTNIKWNDLCITRNWLF